MQLGLIGLGRMGSNMALRLMRAGHECVVYNPRPEALQSLVKEGAAGTTSITEFVARLSMPRAIWLMVPAAAVDDVIATLVPHLAAGDILIDGGNSYYRDDIRRAAELKSSGLHYVDVGTSGGVCGTGARLLPDDRRRAGDGGASRAALSHARAGHRRRAAHARARRRRTALRSRLSPLRAARRRPLREDGSQRHRIRPHGSVRRRA